jgi:pimeloyl-ACP methyl ester carboxylesterase
VQLYREALGDGLAVVLIHEGICDSRMWEPQWQAFASTHRAVRYDMRGFGRSPLPPEPYSNARDLVGLLDEIGIEHAALVGASMGGRVALEVAVARPELVGALVLIGASLPGHDWSETVRTYGAEEERALERGDLEAAVEANLRMWVDGPYRASEAVDPAVRAAVAEMQRRAFELQLPVAEDAEEEPLVPDLAERLGEIRAPTLVLVGKADVEDVHEIAERLHRAIPGARCASIPGAAHVPNMERPLEFNEIVLDFLARL